jgi:hypothetical protein
MCVRNFQIHINHCAKGSSRIILHLVIDTVIDNGTVSIITSNLISVKRWKEDPVVFDWYPPGLVLLGQDSQRKRCVKRGILPAGTGGVA